MKAIRVAEAGGPEVLRLQDIDVPRPGPGGTVVRLEAAGVNFIDIYERTGAYASSLPFTPGREGAGTVEAVGEGVSELEVGRRVAFAMVPGAYAEAVAVPAAKLVPVPDEVELRTAAAVMLQGMTAHYLTHATFPLGPEHTALVLAASGGVGHLLVQLARRRGARVLAAVSSEEKAELARKAGAHEMILYTERELAAETRRLTDGEGVHVVYDSVGKDTFRSSLACVRRRGFLVLYGQSSGPVQPIDPQVLRKGSLFLTRPSLADYVAERAELLERAGDLFRWIAAGELEVRVDRAFPLADAGEAHRYMEARRTKGKLLLEL